ncbi:hypothetical protein [Erwinia sp. JUb26]|uniref:hypothetical protein n=1 Tax=Erwinia sp. JUb26 TaxID=2485126 RepID=UPI000F47AFCC|nr:hypothetical protein [Erwinia sp. JUb26]ROR07578.1 hypothetical protein EC836_1067 [Erwinia sp. JUb26]
MKVMIIFLLILFSGSSYSRESYQSIDLKDAYIAIPTKWNVKEKEGCLFVSKGNMQSTSYLKVCRGNSSSESDYFTMNDDGVWEAITDGVAVLADVNVTTEYTGMSAIVLCKYKDSAGYHTDKCFQAEVDLPSHINFIFTGKGDSSLFNDYKESYLSFKIK